MLPELAHRRDLSTRGESYYSMMVCVCSCATRRARGLWVLLVSMFSRDHRPTYTTPPRSMISSALSPWCLNKTVSNAFVGFLSRTYEQTTKGAPAPAPAAPASGAPEQAPPESSGKNPTAEEADGADDDDDDLLDM